MERGILSMTLTSTRELAGGRVFLTISAFLFIASAAGTICWCSSMSGGMVMPGGWTMSMTWMRMPGQSWAAASTSFLAMWTAMMLAMMMPSLVPMLLNYRRCVRARNKSRLSLLTAVCGTAYFFVWAVFGGVAFTLGVTLARAEMHSTVFARSVPFLTGLVWLLAGGIQLTSCKARQLAQCRLAPACAEALGDGSQNAVLHGHHCRGDYRRTPSVPASDPRSRGGRRHHCSGRHRDCPSRRCRIDPSQIERGYFFK